MRAEIAQPTNDDELWEVVRLLTGIRLARTAVCAGHAAPFDAFSDAYFARHSIAVWKGSRGLAGKTLQLALLGYLESVFLGASIVNLGGSQDQSKRILEYQQMFWDYVAAPRELLLSAPTATQVSLRNGGEVVCQAASQKSARSAHPHRLRLDEVDEMGLDIFDAAMGQTMEGNLSHLGRKRITPQTVASSTHQHADGTMTEILRRAGEKGWPVFEWCYKESMTEWLDPEQVERKRHEVTAEMWRTEYELGEPSIEGRAFVSESVDSMFDPEWDFFEDEIGTEFVLVPTQLVCPRDPFSLPRLELETITQFRCKVSARNLKCNVRLPITSSCIEQNPESGGCRVDASERRCIEHNCALVTAQYVTGADWAKESDWTIIATFRVDKSGQKVLVAYQRVGRMKWPEMIARFNDRMRRYPGRAFHDSTGIGNVVKDYIDAPGSTVTGLVLAGRKRDDLLNEYIAAVERGEYLAPRIRYPYAEHKYATQDSMFGEGHLPDTICAFSLAHRAQRRAPRGWGIARGTDDEE